MSLKLNRVILFLIIGMTLPVFFVNCGPAVEPVYSGSSANRASNNINFFSEEPTVMDGEAGFRFLLKEYFGPHCGSCHSANNPLMKPYFNMADPKSSYELSRIGLNNKADMINRITNNPFCPSCTLDKNGEVFNAIMYWLDHR